MNRLKFKRGNSRMRFMMMVKADENYEAGRPPDPELMEAIGKLTDDMRKAGVVLETGGLYPSSAGARVRVGGGTLTVTDGPFAEAKEVIGGYAIIQAGSIEEAKQSAARFMQIHADILGPSYQGECEIRRMFDPADFARPAAHASR
jgi:hypothetical protein